MPQKITDSANVCAQKIYLCECGSQSAICGGYHNPGGPDNALSKLAGTICAGKQTAVFVCENCGQWARPTATTKNVAWDCLNECAKRGLASNHEVNK